MITQFAIFEKQKISRPNINISWVSDSFWNMVRIINWSSIPKGWTYRNTERIYCSDIAKERLVKNFDWNTIQKFKTTYELLHSQIKRYFEPLWLQTNNLGVSDDGYDDLTSSVVGAGKTFVFKSLKDDQMIIDMCKNDTYKENFGYMFQLKQDEYEEMLTKMDPNRLDSEKFGI